MLKHQKNCYTTAIPLDWWYNSGIIGLREAVVKVCLQMKMVRIHYEDDNS